MLIQDTSELDFTHRRTAENLGPIGDGGDIDFVKCENNVVTVRLRGACSGCPHAAITLKMGVERHLKQRVPEITEVINEA